MPSTKKKSPMSTNKKKKPVSSKASTKKRASSKKNSNSDTTSGDVDGSYLHNVSHTASGGEELLDLQSLNAGSEAILSTLKRLEESNRRIVERMDRIEGNSSASSTPIPSQVAKSTDNVTFRLPRPKHTSPVKKMLPEMTPRANLLHSYKWPAREEVVYPGTQTVTEGYVPASVSGGRAAEQRQGYSREATTPSIDRLRSIPEVSSMVANLLADYEARAQQEVIPGKPLTARRKSGRYNNTETPNARPEGRWPNEGFVAAANTRKPVYDDMSLQQWAAGQLSNVLQIQDDTLLRQVLTQVTLALRDAVALPWPAVRSAWAVSMTEVEEGRLAWDDTTQWALNRVSSSQIAVLNSQNVSTSAKSRVCKFFNEGSCVNDSHHGVYRHICTFCFKQGRSMSHPESKCTAKNGSRSQELKPNTSR